MKREDLLEKVDGALSELEQALAEGDSETMKAYLAFLSRFHNYSFGNVMLIYLQKPDASLVAGYQKWQAMGRQVKKGEHGIRILAPIVRRKAKDDQASDAASEEKPRPVVTGFRGVSVFDVTQTEGDDIPSFHEYSGDPAENLDRLVEFTVSRNIEILWEAPIGGALGVSEDGRIRIRPDLEPADTFAVLVHEVAHELLHKGDRRKDTTKTIRETEAEAVAYAVCSAVGLKDDGTAASYIQLYQGDTRKLQQSLDVIRNTASEILLALEVPEPVAA